MNSIMLTVITRVPKENLLAFNVRQGWEFLCKFLGKAVQQGWFLRQWLLQLLELAGDLD